MSSNSFVGGAVDVDASSSPGGRWRRRVGTAAGLALAVTLPFLCAADDPRNRLSLEERVQAQRAIEQVYWSHRLWPAGNPGPKPAFSEVVPESAIRSRVEESLGKSHALRKYWNSPITPAQLQAELNRMAEHTQDPRMLGELFAALGNDPYLIAETLARDSLSDRLIRDWYAGDDRFHADLRRQVAVAIAGCPDTGCMRSMGGVYDETTWRLGGKTTGHAGREGEVGLAPEEWNVLLAQLAGRLGSRPETLPVLKLSGVEETPEAFVVTAVLYQTRDAVRTATVSWAKVPFSEWWERQRAGVEGVVDETPFGYTLPALDLTPCTPGSWRRTNANVPPIGRRGATAVWTGTEMIVWGGQSALGNGPALYTGGRYNPTTDTWIPTQWGLNTPAPMARFNHTAVWTGTRMIVWGGHNGTTLLNTGGRYDPASDTWSATSTGPDVPSARVGHAAVWSGTQMIVWGGTGDSTGGRYDPSTDTWTPTSIGANVPAQRFSLTAVWTGTEMIVWGGRSDSSGGRYNPATDTWAPTSTGTNVPAPRTNHAAVWTGTTMIVWGGQSTASPNPALATGGRYDPLTDTWMPTSTGTNLPAARGGHTTIWTGTEMIVWGGVIYDSVTFTPSYFDSGGRYNPSTDTWNPTSTGAGVPTGRSGHVAVWTGSSLTVWGGYNGTELASGARYDPATDSWTPTSLGSPMPGGRRAHVAVWTGAEMIIWGGGNFQAAYLNTGGRYDPATDAWRTTSTGPNVPAARLGGVAFWTGTRVIIWGGSYQTNLLNTGGRYDPITDSWLPTSTSPDAPTPRSGFAAAWTGTTMIVWGGIFVDCQTTCNGDCCYELFNTGARYDPLLDTWTPTSIGANVPAPRYSHRAVWTGSQLIVWGGTDGSGLASMNTGGRYDPSLDSWVPTSTGANVPQARGGADTFWTGTRMLVWGGVDEAAPNPDNSVLNSGGLYDPVTDTWTPTVSSPTIPEPRSAHRAIWTGTSLIVWGGYGQAMDGSIVFLNSGGQYSPATGTWLPTSVGASVPPPVSEHTAVWDGAEMIVWGGLVRFDGEAYANAGGRYCPCLSDILLYLDSDGDGYGGAAAGAASCEGTAPPGYAAIPGDCNDGNPAIHPGAMELCNSLDDNCDGTIDNAAPPGPVSAVTLGGEVTTLQWSPLPGAQTYDIIYGSLGLLGSSGGDFSVATQGCFANNFPQTSVAFEFSPGYGSGYWLLVRGNSCGGAGTYDGEAGQVEPRDAEIAAAPGACP